MIKFTTIIKKFGQQGEKTGWTYIEISADIAEKLNADVRKSFRVKGLLDFYKITGIALLLMGGGLFIMALNAAIRKGIAKKEGAMLNVSLEIDTVNYELNELLVEGINVSPIAQNAFFKMPRSHQNYYSKWIESAKTNATQHKRIVLVVMALESGLSYSEMLREQTEARKIL